MRMRRPASYSLFLCTVLIAAACESEPDMPDLIPVPESVITNEGEFRLTSDTKLLVSDPGDPELVRLAEYLAGPIRSAAGFSLPVGRHGDISDGSIRLTLNSDA
ncbi:MAG: glycoside hydrolase family 20 zincin-like fold domain-containing protein, partial [Gemmatimonadota bacterium]